MAVTYDWDSQRVLERFQEDWDRLWGLARYPRSAGLFDRSNAPNIDVAETEGDCTLWIDVPGLEKKDIELTIAANVLTLKGEKHPPRSAKAPKDNERVYRDETWTGSFERSLALPDSVDPEKVTAEIQDGVLKVVMAKKAELKPRSIPVAVR